MVLEENMSFGSVANSLGINKGDLQYWTNLYKIHGPDSFQKSGNNKYTGEFKLQVIEYMHINQISCRSAAAHFGIRNQSTVSIWKKIYHEKGPAGLLNKKRKGRPPKMEKTKPKNPLPIEKEEDLITEVQRLRMENEYLKKLQALVRERIARENGKESPSSKN